MNGRTMAETRQNIRAGREDQQISYLRRAHSHLTSLGCGEHAATRNTPENIQTMPSHFNSNVFSLPVDQLLHAALVCSACRAHYHNHVVLRYTLRC